MDWTVTVKFNSDSHPPAGQPLRFSDDNMNELAAKALEDLNAAIVADALILPTLPEVAWKIREACEDPDVDLARLSRVIGSDTALSARLMKVVNSPTMRPLHEVRDLQGAISRLGINYSCNLAIGLVIEQIFHARSPIVAQKMHDIWRSSLEIAGISHELARRFTRLPPDQAALAGLVHQIGALPILGYAEEATELLDDLVSLEYVIEQLHPQLGRHILAQWDFPPTLVEVPEQYQNLRRLSPQVDYADVVTVANLINQREADPEPFAQVPAWRQLGLHAQPGLSAEELDEARKLFS